ncbi:MAG: hypothetical protein AAF500_21780 [Myxococcota bacterium]
MKSPRSTGLLRDRGPQALRALVVVSVIGSVASSAAPGRAQTGSVQCVITANSAPARGTIVVSQPQQKEVGGTCGVPLRVAPGKWKATVRLDGTLDNPSKQVPVEVNPGKTTQVAVDFRTGTLEVRIVVKGGRGTGLVTVNQGSKRIGTLGAGVPVLLSAGEYEVVVRYDGREQRHKIDLRAGQRRLLRTQF